MKNKSFTELLLLSIEEEKKRSEKIEKRAILMLSFLGLTYGTLLGLDLFKNVYNFWVKYNLLRWVFMIFFVGFTIITIILCFAILHGEIEPLSISPLENCKTKMENYYINIKEHNKVYSRLIKAVYMILGVSFSMLAYFFLISSFSINIL